MQPQMSAMGEPERIMSESRSERQTITFKTYTPEQRVKLLQRNDHNVPHPKNAREVLKMLHLVKLHDEN